MNKENEEEGLAQQVKALVTKSDDLSLIPGAHIAETTRELALPRCSLTFALIMH